VCTATVLERFDELLEYCRAMLYIELLIAVVGALWLAPFLWVLLGPTTVRGVPSIWKSVWCPWWRLLVVDLWESHALSEQEGARVWGLERFLGGHLVFACGGALICAWVEEDGGWSRWWLRIAAVLVGVRVALRMATVRRIQRGGYFLR
jgi:hypothetical protein